MLLFSTDLEVLILKVRYKKTVVGDSLQDPILLKCEEKGLPWDEGGWIIMDSLLSIGLGTENIFFVIMFLVLLFFILSVVQTQNRKSLYEKYMQSWFYIVYYG